MHLGARWAVYPWADETYWALGYGLGAGELGNRCLEREMASLTMH